MINVKDNVFQLDTEHTTYLLRIDETKHVRTEYFGKKIRTADNYDFSKEKWAFALGSSVVFDKAHPELSLDNLSLEYSTVGKGDFREPSILLKTKAGFTADFLYQGFEIKQGIEDLESLPTPHTGGETLVLHLEDTTAKISLDLSYVIFTESDVIIRNTKIINKSSETFTLNKLMSFQLDLLNQKFELVNLYGGWASEMHRSEKTLGPGIYINDSKTGASSNRHNPFFMLKSKDSDLNHGNVYAFNLIYSGNHYEMVEVNSYGKIRLQAGINPFCFEWSLKPEESFISPWGVLSFSDQGKNGASQHMHHFINHHVIRGDWALKDRPVLLNNWEATYFDFTENKLHDLLKRAKDFGIELFVLDDGWFGKRTDDTKGLGDWEVNPKKLPHGLERLADSVNKAGLKFGLWFEPEMVNEDSELFRSHPEWAIKTPDRVPSYGRNQIVLDLGLEEVQKYIVDSLSKILDSANIEYVKWDMNRHMSDFYSSRFDQGEFFHRYILGLYHVLETLTKKYPHVLWESCSSGGNRNDLGILSYMQQNWASDDTDAFERLTIQSGTAMAYPLSTIGAHVSASPSHQLLRRTPIDTRFNVASFGTLGYELDLKKLSPVEEEAVKDQIVFYKEHRHLLQYGSFYQLKTLEKDGYVSWMVLSDDRKEGIISYFQGLGKSNPTVDILQGTDFIEDALYHVSARHQETNIKTFGGLLNMALPVNLNEDGRIIDLISKHKTIEELLKKSYDENYDVYGDAINNGAIKLSPQWSGTGFNEYVRVLADFGSRLYYFKTK
ncbi:MAG: alpha-galactosidase [Firmicutes bacterium]|nr:alpha-galactosidase [Bacillota bacterium]